MNEIKEILNKLTSMQEDIEAIKAHLGIETDITYVETDKNGKLLVQKKRATLSDIKYTGQLSRTSLPNTPKHPKQKLTAIAPDPSKSSPFFSLVTNSYLQTGAS